MTNKSAINIGWRAGAKWGTLCGLTLLSIAPFSWLRSIEWLLQQPTLPRGYLFSTAAWLVPIILVAVAQALLGMHAARLMFEKGRSTLVTSVYVGGSLWLVYIACWIMFAFASYILYHPKYPVPASSFFNLDLLETFLNSISKRVILLFSFSYAMCLELLLMRQRARAVEHAD
jgi:hypothetical protein